MTDLDDAHCYSVHSKPRTNPLDFCVSAFYFLPATRHAACLTASHPVLRVNVLPAIDLAQFADADV